MCDMLSPLYALLVLVTFPTIPADLKVLREDNFKVREAATERLKILPGWTVFFFNEQARKAKDQEVRLRCARVRDALQRKWDDVLLERKADLIRALYQTIPGDIKTLEEHLGEQHGPFDERVNAKSRLDYLPGFTAPYFEYYSRKASKPEVRTLSERIGKRKEKEWREILASGSFLYMQRTYDRIELRKRLPRFLAKTISNLSKLSPEDLKLVEAQGGCPIYEPGCLANPLGSVGVPVKITLKDQTVFLCCKDHIKNAQADPDKTLAALKQVKRRGLMGFQTKKTLEAKLSQMCDFLDER